MTGDSKDSLISALCGPEIWQWDSNGSCSISFKKDGTGLLRAGAELSIFIAAEFAWELKSSENTEDNPSFDIQITLTTRVHPYLRESRQHYTLLNEQALTSAAFQPKTYTIRLEEGRFDEPATPWVNSPPFLHRPPKFALRLSFDKSPFPPLEEWREEAKFAAEQCRFWEYKEFADKEVPRDGVLAALLHKVTG
ncbi:hypothetical protein JX266_010320 [Neoarthrinium moseri]|nr:hypothetical protein JX266_010320 [Neoarthrinium moseri]